MVKRRRPKASARPAVVHLTCPGCGGDVSDAELGEKSTCRYCGVELHVPDVQLQAPPATPPRPVTQASEPPRRPAFNSWGTVALLATVTLVAVGAIAMSAGPSPSPTASAPGKTPVVSDDTEGILAGARCLVDCNRPCLEIKDPDGMVRCLDACQSRCKLVGKGTRAECSDRCQTRCNVAPDESRGLCLSGCLSDCPPE